MFEISSRAISRARCCDCCLARRLSISGFCARDAGARATSGETASKAAKAAESVRADREVWHVFMGNPVLRVGPEGRGERFETSLHATPFISILLCRAAGE